MGNTLKAGTLGSPDWDGTSPTFTDKMPPEFRDSLAAAIEKALNEALNAEGKAMFPTEDNSAETRDRRLLFVAIAQGIVRYLKENEEAFVITNSSGTPVANRKIVIKKV